MNSIQGQREPHRESLVTFVTMNIRQMRKQSAACTRTLTNIRSISIVLARILGVRPMLKADSICRYARLILVVTKMG